LVLFFETGFLCSALAALELARRPDWPRTRRSELKKKKKKERKKKEEKSLGLKECS
jgi:hypothetical protein